MKNESHIERTCRIRREYEDRKSPRYGARRQTQKDIRKQEIAELRALVNDMDEHPEDRESYRHELFLLLRS